MKSERDVAASICGHRWADDFRNHRCIAWTDQIPTGSWLEQDEIADYVCAIDGELQSDQRTARVTADMCCGDVEYIEERSAVPGMVRNREMARRARAASASFIQVCKCRI